MRKTKFTVKSTTQFKKDYKMAMKRGVKIGLLDDVIAALATGEKQGSCLNRKLGGIP